MNTQLSAVILAFCFLLPSCNRPKATAMAKEPDKYHGLVMVNLRGANIAIPDKETEEWAIRKAAVLYQLKGMKNRRCYLEVNVALPPKVVSGHQDPRVPPPPPEPPAFRQIAIPDVIMLSLRTLSDVVVKRTSECESTRNGVIDKGTGQDDGDVISVGDILWLSPTVAEVSVDWWAGPDAASSTTCYLKKVDGFWQVTGEKLDSVS